MKIQVTCLVFPTEDERRIEAALSNLFPPVDTKYSHLEQCNKISLDFTTRDGLSIVRQYVHELRIIDVVKSRLEANLDGNITFFHLDKQAASIGKVRLLDDTNETPPLGSIEITIDSLNETELESFMSWFVPLTKDGKIVQN